MNLVFPEGFLWGVTTGAHQTEGNNLASDYWARETSGTIDGLEPSGDAADSYHRWREDMDLVAEAGFSDFRFGIEWSRVEPADGLISRAAIAHYERVVAGAIGRGLRPLPTLHHFTVPLWFAQAGGWRNPDAISRFLRFVDLLSPLFDLGVERVETINEPNVYASLPALAAQGGSISAGMPIPDPDLSRSMIELHDATRSRLKRAHPHLLVGWGVSVQDYQPDAGAEGVFESYVQPRDQDFIEVSRDDDWIGVQTYTRGRIRDIRGTAEAYAEPGAALTQTGWEDYPPALGGAVRRVSTIVGTTPIIVTENGIATDDDDRRIAFISAALQSLDSAMRDGVDVRGYLHWSLLDNYEWGSFAPKFGLVAVNRETFERSPKPSLGWLGALAPTPRATTSPTPESQT